METLDQQALLDHFHLLTLPTFQHYKGPLYLVLGLGHDANDAERTTVVYLPLSPVDGPPFAVRTFEDFTAWVDPQTGELTTPGLGVQRFTRIDSPRPAEDAGAPNAGDGV